jgi:hypothetical protein
MELNVLLWILGGGFTGTWGLCIFFMNRTDNAILQMRIEIKAEISEIRKEISEIKNCLKDHHSRLCVIEEKKESGK